MHKIIPSVRVNVLEHGASAFSPLLHAHICVHTHILTHTHIKPQVWGTLNCRRLLSLRWLESFFVPIITA